MSSAPEVVANLMISGIWGMIMAMWSSKPVYRGWLFAISFVSMFMLLTWLDTIK